MIGAVEQGTTKGARTGLPHRALLITVLAFAAATAIAVLPILAMPGSALWSLALVMLIAAIGGGLVVWLSKLLSPLGALAHVLETSAEGAGEKAAPGEAIDSAVRMHANAELMAARLEKWKRRPRRHALTGLPLQDEFLSLANDDIESKPRKVLLGLVRFANYDAMAAFDPIGAERALALFARRLKEALDPSRALAHIDRDCFAIWFRGVAPEKESAAELQALSYVLAQDIEISTFTVMPDVQIGSALYPIDSTDAANLLSRAFVSLARPQRSASGALAFFSGPSPEETARRFTLEQKLRQAIEQRQLELHYQPIIDTVAGAVVGAEALLRWRHPSMGLVSPTEFVPILEDTGLIEEIGMWTLNTVCRHLRYWRDGGLDLRIAINISARQLREPLLPKMIARTLASHKLSPNDLELELTETAAMEDSERTLKVFQQLREEGFGLSIDDFGSGYSSLGYLRTLPFSKLKIDREFVSHVDTRPGSRAICKALIELAKGLDITILAEGVERYEEVETLRQLGCETFQGFYFARAVPANSLRGAIAAGDWRALASSPVHRQQAHLRRRISE
jgi:EAL domain-containing protein (putative c-di-GMP-specific phosphodiesterase class I)/GGDEF domain-containing protein